MIRIKKRLSTLILLHGILLMSASECLLSQDISEDKKVVKLADDFRVRLSNAKGVGDLFAENWSLIYHVDNRCDGSTDGDVRNLSTNQIDSVIKVQVRNDGDGWACDKKEPNVFDFDFSLSKMVKDWDRFQVIEFDSQNKLFFIHGRGESDYLKVYYSDFGDKYLITKLEYRSEDPG